MSRYGPCMCGACDCPSCGPAQGYEVVQVWNGRQWVWTNPEDDDGEDGEGDAPDVDVCAEDVE